MMLKFKFLNTFYYKANILIHRFMMIECTKRCGFSEYCCNKRLVNLVYLKPSIVCLIFKIVFFFDLLKHILKTKILTLNRVILYNKYYIFSEIFKNLQITKTFMPTIFE